MGDGQPGYRREAGRLQFGLDVAGMEVEIQLDKLNRLPRERIPPLPAEQPAADRLEVLLVGEFEDILPSRPGDAAQLPEEGGHVGCVVDRPHLDHRFEQAGDKRHSIPVAGHKYETGVAAEPLLGFAQQGARVVKQNHMLIAVVLIGQPAEPGPQIDQPAASRPQKPAQGAPFNPIFVVTPLIFPEAGPVIRPFVIANGGGVGHLLSFALAVGHRSVSSIPLR